MQLPVVAEPSHTRTVSHTHTRVTHTCHACHTHVLHMAHGMTHTHVTHTHMSHTHTSQTHMHAFHTDTHHVTQSPTEWPHSQLLVVPTHRRISVRKFV